MDSIFRDAYTVVTKVARQHHIYDVGYASMPPHAKAMFHISCCAFEVFGPVYKQPSRKRFKVQRTSQDQSITTNNITVQYNALTGMETLHGVQLKDLEQVLCQIVVLKETLDRNAKKALAEGPLRRAKNDIRRELSAIEDENERLAMAREMLDTMKEQEHLSQQQAARNTALRTWIKAAALNDDQLPLN